MNLPHNLALSAARMSHVMYADVDFWPLSGLHSTLSSVAVRGRLMSNGRLAGVILAR